MKITDGLKGTPKSVVPKIRLETTNKELLESQEYKSVMEVVGMLYHNGILTRSAGFCLSTSDMLLKLLDAKGISSSLQECSLTVSINNPPALSLVGHDGFTKHLQDYQGLDSHIVVVTNTEIPMLIDLSIGIYDPNIPYICEPLNPTDKASLSQYTFHNSTWYYESKGYSKLPKLHQQSILERIKTDKIIFKKISFINKLLIGLFVISSLNFIRGGADYYIKYINTNNGFGLSKVDNK